MLSLEVSLGSFESWRGSVGDEALGEMKVDPEEREKDEDGRRVGKGLCERIRKVVRVGGGIL